MRSKYVICKIGLLIMVCACDEKIEQCQGECEEQEYDDKDQFDEPLNEYDEDSNQDLQDEEDDADSSCDADLADHFTDVLTLANGTPLLNTINQTEDIYWSDATTDEENNVTAVGVFETPIEIGEEYYEAEGFMDIVVAKLNTQGGFVWSRHLGGDQDDYGNSVAIDTDGNVIVTGQFGGTVDFGDMNRSAASSDLFVAKLDGANGSTLWSKSFGGRGSDEGRGIAVDESNNIYLTGSFQHIVNFGGIELTATDTVAADSDIFLAKFTPDGSHVWSGSFGNGNPNFGNGIAVDSAGNVILTGEFWHESTIDFGDGPWDGQGGSDVFLVKLSQGAESQFNVQWSKALGSPGRDRGTSVSVDSSDNIYLLGAFEESFSFDGHLLTLPPDADTFALSFSPSGDYRCSEARYEYDCKETGFMGTDCSVPADSLLVTILRKSDSAYITKGIGYGDSYVIVEAHALDTGRPLDIVALPVESNEMNVDQAWMHPQWISNQTGIDLGIVSLQSDFTTPYLWTTEALLETSLPETFKETILDKRTWIESMTDGG